MARIFISYRRDDSGGWAGWLSDRLRQHFGRDNVFMDIDAIEPGLDFVEVIGQTVGSCDALIALIGKQWLTITDDSGLLEPEMILIPAGEFLIGSDPQQDKDALDKEQPQHRLSLPDYFLAKTSVTQAQYKEFVRATGHEAPQGWANGTPPPDMADHPVMHVSWYDTRDYCQWLSQVTGKDYRLPSEVEWEKGARGIDGRIYPWGNQWDAMRCNSWESGLDKTTSVHAYPQGASPDGLLDMAGNVWEWTRSL